MPAKKKPAYLLHKPTGQARVRIDGKDHYLGAYDSPQSYSRYDALVTAWLRKQELLSVTLTVDALVLLYLDYANSFYVKDGKPTSEIDRLRSVVRPLVRLFGTTWAREFGPLKLKRVREELVKLGWTRSTVNSQVDRLKRMFRWAVENEHVPPSVLTALEAVAGLRKGKTAAPDRPPVQPVPSATVDATLPHLSPIVADMVRLQRLTGMRPAEVCLLRPCDIDRTGEVWTYRPSSHKTEHKGRERVVFIGPKGQDVLRGYLLRDASAFCFSPVEADAERRERLSESRVTPLSCGNKPGTNRKATPARKPGERYTSASYRRAIERAAMLAFPMPDEYKLPRKVRLPEKEADRRRQLQAEWRKANTWHPNQLRHSAATEIRKQFGLEAAQVTLGHARADVSQVYAERDYTKAAQVAAAVG